MSHELRNVNSTHNHTTLFGIQMKDSHIFWQNIQIKLSLLDI